MLCPLAATISGRGGMETENMPRPETYLNFIDNRPAECAASATLAVINPATGEVAARAALATHADADRAVLAAARAQRDWRRLPQSERAAQLLRLAAAIEERAERIGRALALESGKSLDDSVSETRYACEILRYHAGWARRIEGEVIPSDSPSENLLLMREPYGVVACLIPFNYPIYTLLRKISPALVTGNAVVVRPSNHTPTSALELADAVSQSGLPSGLVNVLAMDNDTARIVCTHPEVRMLTLTGSVAAGRCMLEYSKSNMAKCSLELGGKTPAIVEPDTDLSRASREIAASRLTHCGQLCTAVERVYVQRGVEPELCRLLEREMGAKRFGDRAQDSSCMGPLVTAEARERVHGMVVRARDEGATLALGGFVPEGPGFFYPPTLLTGCRQEMEIVREEIFGPVLCVIPYDTFEEALTLASDHQYGLASVLYTDSYRKALRAANQIEAGELYVNRTPADPYQGYHAGWKRSGLGGDDGKHGMLEFTQTRLVVMNYA